MASLPKLRAELDAEHEDLDRLVAGLPASEWTRPTPAPGWTVHDQIGHLAYFDRTASLAVVDHDGFAAHVEELLSGRDSSEAAELTLEEPRSMSSAEVLGWWRVERAALLTALETLDPGERVPWYGPSMGATSFVTARLMETWAHGQDVADALDRARTPTDRLRHICHLGVMAREFSYQVRGLTPPSTDVHVELVLPSGATVAWGDEATDDRIRGPAFDFALVVVQRRHVADTQLDVTGSVAREWMQIAQAFAGPPGTGREPGQGLA